MVLRPGTRISAFSPAAMVLTINLESILWAYWEFSFS
jgi:hypothetical protein